MPPTAINGLAGQRRLRQFEPFGRHHAQHAPRSFVRRGGGQLQAVIGKIHISFAESRLLHDRTANIGKLPVEDKVKRPWIPIASVISPAAFK